MLKTKLFLIIILLFFVTITSLNFTLKTTISTVLAEEKKEEVEDKRKCAQPNTPAQQKTLEDLNKKHNIPSPPAPLSFDLPKTPIADYCAQAPYLIEYVRLSQLGLINDCNAQSINLATLSLQVCTELFCKEEGDKKIYYKDATEARYLKEAKSLECEIEQSDPAKCLQDRDAKILECQNCKSEIDEHSTKQAQGQNSTLDNKCKNYQNVNNCTTHFVCAEDKNTPTEQQNSGRAPFETEFFDVTSVEKGLSTNQNQNFKTDHEGGALIGVINTIANFLVKMITTISLLVFIIGAFILITANGEENQLNRGKDAIKYSLLGIVIVMLSYTIVVLTQSALF